MPPKCSMVVFTCTYYTCSEESSASDVRYEQCYETIEHAGMHGIPIVIVDGSPDQFVSESFSRAGAIVHKQTVSGGKGAALREAAVTAANLPGVTDETLLCWQEPEKTDMIRKWMFIGDLKNCIKANDIVVPRRERESFESSYPIEQFHSESYGNLYLDAVMKDAIEKNPESMAMPKANHATPRGTSLIDWHFGPFAFKAKHLQLWEKYNGNSYDAQLVPIVHGIRKGLRVASVDVDFILDEKMKKQEEENIAFIEKRLNQLNDLDPKVKAAWTSEPYC